MAGPIQEARRSLREITEAAAELVRVQSLGTRAREQAIQGLVDASSQSDLAFRHFALPAEKDWPRTLEVNEAIESATLELQSAKILAAASVVIGEMPANEGVTPIESLKGAVEDAKTELLQLQDKHAFWGKVIRGEPSSDPSAAKANFRAAANKTIDSIVSDTDRMVSSAVEGIKKKGKDLLTAFDSFAQLLSSGPEIEGLIKRAWEKCRSALRILSQILDSVPLDDLREKLQTVRDAVKTRSAIEFLYQTSETRNMIDQLQFRATLSEIELDQSRDQVSQLARGFSTFAKTAAAISAAAGVVIGIVTAHMTGPVAVLAIPGTYAFVAAVVLVIGIGLNNAWLEIPSVRGIRDIAREMSLVRAEGA